ncbi:MAG: metallophosphoesterase [Euryarchaeota archaeon]|nr:metallophosphoesterase [Euryarchaeota archaeon]
MLQYTIANHDLFQILPEVANLFASEDAVIHIDTTTVPTLIVADIHGDMNALQSALCKRSELGCDTVVFLGDYIDRGPASLDVLECLFSLKLNEPDTIILLHGNHELKETNRFERLFEDLEYDEDLYARIKRVFIRCWWVQ